MVSRGLRWLVTGPSLRRPGFDIRSGHVKFVMDKVGQFSLSICALPTHYHSTSAATHIYVITTDAI
jgi:hypothetical protein